MIILSVLIVIAGIFSSFQLKKETMPDISIPIIAVITPYPGASPDDIMRDVTKPIEQSLGSLKGVETLDSTTSENSSAIILQYSFSADMDEAKKDVDEALKSLNLPDGALDPQVSRISFTSFPMMQLAVSDASMTPEELQEWTKTTVVPALEQVDGVAKASLNGEKTNSVAITLKPEALKEHNLTASFVKQQLEAANVRFPVGSLLLEGTQQPVNVTGNITTLEELKHLQIPLFPDPNEQMKEAFEDIGEGMNALGQAVGGLAQGLAGTTKALNGSDQLLSAIHDTESQLFTARLALKDTEGLLKKDDASPEERAIAEATVEQLTAQITMGEGALGEMKAKLSEIQKAIGSASAPAPAAKPAKKEKAEPAISLVSLDVLADIAIVPSDTTSISRVNGEPSITIGIIKSQEANTVDVSEDVQAKLDKLGGGQVEILFDEADMVNESIGAMVKEGALGSLFACIIILVFLRNIRSTLISVVSIPLSLLIALLCLHAMDISLNILTLGALAIAVGRVVDDSIVVIENIYRKLQEAPRRTVDVIKLAAKEVIPAITSSTLATMAVFLPLAFVSGMIGVMFKPFAFTVAIALLASLLVSVTIVPMLAKFMLLKGKLPAHKEKETRMMRGYRSTLVWSLSHKFWTLLIATLLFVGSILLIPSIGTTFMPSSDQTYVDVRVELPAGTAISVTDKQTKEVESILQRDPAVKTIQTTVGSSGVALDSSGGNHVGSLFVQLKDGKSIDAIMKKWDKTLEPLRSDDRTITLKETDPESGGGNTNAVEVVVKGDDLEQVKKTASLLTDKLASQKSLSDVRNNLAESKPEITVDVDQEKASRLGLSAAQIGATLNEFIGQSKIGSVTFDGKKMDLTYGIQLDKLEDWSSLQTLTFTSALGKDVELQSFADVREVDGPATILSRDGRQYASVTATIKEANTGKVTAEVMALVAKMDTPKGVDISTGGTIDQMNESFMQMGMAILVAIGTVYLVMVIAFGEARAPFAILFSLPLAMIGGLLGLFLAGIPLDMPGMIGFLMLIGIVVTNAIVLLDRVQHNRTSGLSMRESLVEAGTVRLRPILMTALATMGALTPLAIGLHSSTILSQSLAIVVIGGLASSTVLTLVVVPVIFELLYWKRKKKRKA